MPSYLDIFDEPIESIEGLTEYKISIADEGAPHRVETYLNGQLVMVVYTELDVLSAHLRLYEEVPYQVHLEGEMRSYTGLGAFDGRKVTTKEGKWIEVEKEYSVTDQLVQETISLLDEEGDPDYLLEYNAAGELVTAIDLNMGDALSLAEGKALLEQYRKKS